MICCHKETQFRMILLVFFVFSIAPVLQAEVTDSSANGFTVRNTASIGASPSAVYRHLVADIGRWWSSAHTFSGNAHNLTIEEKANGCFCETLEGGGSVRHLTVVFAEPGKTLRLTGGLGPLQAMAITGTLTWAITEHETGSIVTLTYAVGGYRPGGLQILAAPVDAVLHQQLQRLKRYIETGSAGP